MASLFLFCVSCILTWAPGYTEQVTDHIGDSLEKQYGEIRYAALIFRHGERNPMSTGYPSDPYRNYSWLEGHEQLTRKGKQRMFELGSWFKRRYRNLVQDSYNREDVIMESSETDRAIMSGLCFLRGFYPATGSQVWLKNEQWQPIPVHTIPRKYDNMIALYRKCPLLKRVMSDTFADPKYTRMYQNYQDTIEYIAEHAGFNVSSKTITESLVIQLFFLHDTLFTQSENNLTLPNWTKRVYPEPLATMLLLTEYDESYGEEGKRLTAGPILKSIISGMELKKKNADFTRKLHLYSAHELIISRVMVALDVPISGKIPYGTTLMFELRKHGYDDVVTISIKNTTNGQPYLLSIPGCRSVCMLDDFLHLAKPLIPQDWEQECRVNSSPSHITDLNNLLSMAFVLIFLLK